MPNLSRTEQRLIWHVLYMQEAHGQHVTQAAIARYLRVTRPTAHYYVHKLAGRGLLTIQHVPGHRPVIEINPTGFKNERLANLCTR